MIQDIRKFVGRLGVVIAGVAAAPLASAAIVTGSWDPPLPQGSFPGLGWAASVVVSVDDRCLSASGDQSTGLLTNIPGFSGCPGGAFVFPAFSILSAQVGIYDLGTGLINDVLDFSFTTEIQLQLGVGGSIDYLSALLPTEPRRGTQAFSDDFEFRLLLTGENPVLQYRDYRGPFNFRSFSTVENQEFATQFGVYEDGQQAQALGDARLVIGATVFDVPEPGSLALSLLALCAAGACAVRRGRKSA